MPTRTFVLADFIPISSGWISGPDPAVNMADLDPIVANIAAISLIGSGSNADAPRAELTPGAGVFNNTFSIDFDRFPEIPQGATISEIRIRTFFNNNWNLSANAAPGETAVCSIPNFFYATPAQNLAFPLLDNGESASLATGEPNGVEEYLYDATYFFDNYGTTTITREQMVSDFGTQFVALFIVSNTYSTAIGGSCTLDYSMVVTGFEMRVTYTDAPFSFELQNPSRPLNPAVPTPITVLDPDDELLEGVEQVIIDYTDENGDPQQIIIDLPFLVQTPTLLTFLMPILVGNPMVVMVTLVGDGVIFSGSVVLGFLPTIYFLGGSGIYELSLDQAFDTIYINEEPGDTVNVNIPDPFGRTGFIGG